jgi:D-alanyl-D-alanine carboxypeptidase (penicillin-binding protein 5/6)
MNDMDYRETHSEAEKKRALSSKERRAQVEARIKELRKKKRREKRGRKTPTARALPAIIVIFFFLLCLLSSLFTLKASGEAGHYLSTELPASNLEDVRQQALPSGNIAEPVIPAKAAYLLDPQTDDVLYSKNPSQRMPIASTTKIMTAIITMENGNLQDTVTISEKASSVGESSAWLSKGETLTVEQLLYALLVQSANDAAVSLAEYIAGTEGEFVEMMNRKAEELGATDTHFANSHGLDQEGHYSTARDLALISSYAMQNPLFREIVKSSGYQIPWPGHPFPRVLENHNKLLKMYPYATGIKTGYTLGAGKCLVASATKGDRELISVILNADDTYWDQTIQLLEYGFNCFARVEFAYAGQELAKVEVGDFPRQEVSAVPRADLAFTVRRDYLSAFEVSRVYFPQWIPYPVSKDQEIGFMMVADGSSQETREPLVSASNRSTPNILLRFLAFIASILGLWWRCIRWLIPGI